MVKIEGEIQSMKEKLDLFLSKLDVIIEKYQTHDNPIEEPDANH